MRTGHRCVRAPACSTDGLVANYCRASTAHRTYVLALATAGSPWLELTTTLDFAHQAALGGDRQAAAAVVPGRQCPLGARRHDETASEAQLPLEITTRSALEALTRWVMDSTMTTGVLGRRWRMVVGRRSHSMMARVAAVATSDRIVG
jgi:hypothetical protein